MTRSNTAEPSDSTSNRKRSFNASDVAIFVVFPLLLLGGFLLFMYLKRSAADPNLRLIAQVTDIHVKFEGISSQRESITSPKVGEISRLTNRLQ